LKVRADLKQLGVFGEGVAFEIETHAPIGLDDVEDAVSKAVTFVVREAQKKGWPLGRLRVEVESGRYGLRENPLLPKRVP